MAGAVNEKGGVPDGLLKRNSWKRHSLLASYCVLAYETQQNMVTTHIATATGWESRVCILFIPFVLDLVFECLQFRARRKRLLRIVAAGGRADDTHGQHFFRF